MFSAGDTVIHLTAGICRIYEIREEKFLDKKQPYYVMHPLSDSSSTLYVPVCSGEEKLRRPLSEQEILQLLDRAAEVDVPWIDNNSLRKSAFTELLHSGDPCKQVALVARLHRQKEYLHGIGRKFPVGDERILKEAEKYIHGEFSYSLSLEESEVPAYILSHWHPASV